MKQSNEMWSKSTKAIINGVLLFSVAGVLYPIFNFLKSTASGLSSVASFVGESSSALSGSALVFTITCYVLLAGIIFGYYLYLNGLANFSLAVNPADSNSVKKIRTGVILVLLGWGVAFLFGFIPFAGWLGSLANVILCIVAYILMLIEFSALKKSTTFPESARSGASLLFIALILLIIGTILDLIPLIGWVFMLILSLVGFILTIIGWKRIKSAA
ncbi:MAG: hypothetical protein FWH23_07610 [Bacteroidales bacterium]|nr:hypothetical protein [Bacteroidales bacterium]